MGDKTSREIIIMVALIGIAAAKVESASGGMSGWNSAPNTQYHIQTDEGDERYFKYQTVSGQYRKEKRLHDGTVVGSYGWVDPNGYLRLRDYVADNAGYRVVRTKMVYVGKDEPIGNAISKSKNVPSQGGTGVSSLSVTPSTTPSTVASPAITSTYSPTFQVSTPQPPVVPINQYSYPSSNQNALSSQFPNYSNSPSNSLLPPAHYSINPYIYTASRPSYTLTSDRRNYDQQNSNYDNNYQSIASTNVQRYQQPYSNSLQQQQQQQYPLYDGIAATHNGFRYYLPRQYHEEENSGSDTRAGSFGYIDPFGIRRVIYYNTAPGTGFVHRKNNRYVGFNATPYDPRPPY